MSRIFKKDRAFIFNDANDLKSQFQQEYQYYSSKNRYKSIFDKTALCKNINLQLIVGYSCNRNCSFCCEKNSSCIEVADEKYLDRLSEILYHNSYRKTYLDISITGGEPSLKKYQNKVIDIINLCKMYNDEVRRMTLNSNCYDKDFIKHTASHLNGINISCYDKDLDLSMLDNKNITLQAMLSDSDNIDSLKHFMDTQINDNNLTSFSFRVKYGDIENAGKFNSEFLKCDDFDFIQQKVGYFFFYNHFKYRGCFVRLVYAEKDLISKNDEINNIQLYPNATVGYNWIKEKED